MTRRWSPGGELGHKVPGGLDSCRSVSRTREHLWQERLRGAYDALFKVAQLQSACIATPSRLWTLHTASLKDVASIPINSQCAERELVCGA